MIDDPFACLAYGILLLAGGMYPVGFLFGACSACCNDCPPECSMCTHYVDTDDNCEQLIDDVIVLTYSMAGYGTVSINNPGAEPSSGCGDDSLAIPANDLPDGFEYFTLFGQPCVYPAEISYFRTTDECECSVCGLEIRLTAQVLLDNDGNLKIEKSFRGLYGSCDVTSPTFTAVDDWQITNQQNIADPSAIVAWFNAQEFAVAAEIPECECGACCDNGCTENVAHGGCQTWQGVGVDCDPDPCV